MDMDDFLTTVVPMDSQKFAQTFAYGFGGDGCHGIHSQLPVGELEHKKLLQHGVLPRRIVESSSGGVAGPAGSPPAAASTSCAAPATILAAQALYYRSDVSRVQPEWFAPVARPVEWNAVHFLDQKLVAGGAAAGPPVASGTGGHHLAASTAPTRGVRDAGVDVSLTLNWTRVASVFDVFLRQARLKFDGRAFLHWYTACGIEEDEFRSAFDCVEGIVDSYRRAACR